jgi:ABC-type phosphate transport system substrate-binding protein
VRTPKILLFAAIAAFAVPWTLTITQPRAATVVYRVIVHPSNPATVVDRKFVADAFLKKISRWNESEAIRPVDLEVDNLARRKFSEDILRRSVSAVKSYWQQMVFSGRDVPPPELDTDEDVIRFVLRYSGSIGYVSGNANLDRVKAVTVK